MVEKKHLFLDQQQQEETTRISLLNVAVADSPLSGDEAYEVNDPSPKKRKGSQKKVITIPIGEGDYGSSRSRGEVYPPPDSWSWRKYGQKPIKGSPYPRGYYRCSSSKGCSARKQVERNRHDPTMLLITYTCDHNHHHHLTTTTASDDIEIKSTFASTSSNNSNVQDEPTKAEFTVPEFDSENGRFSELTGELGWFSGLVESTLYESSIFLDPKWSEIDKAVMLKVGEEDELLFGDLGELPECSTVFRRVMVGETPCRAGS